LSCSQPKYNITTDKLSKLKIGMTYSQTVDIIGLPLTIDVLKSITHTGNDCKKSIDNSFLPVLNDNLQFKIDSIYADTSYCCQGYKNGPIHNTSTFNYYLEPKHKNKPTINELIYLLTQHPKLWVHFDKQGRLICYGLRLTMGIIMGNESETIYEGSNGSSIICDGKHKPKYTAKEINYWLSQL
jgi:hypothetical protein